jgi:hypothetical protein
MILVSLPVAIYSKRMDSGNNLADRSEQISLLLIF